MSDMIRVSICDGKYTIVQDATGRTSVLRNGEAWRDAVGDGVILGAAYEIEELRERVEELEEALYESAALNINWSETAESEDLAFFSEYRAVIAQAKAAIPGRFA